jgi:hypothetical protein
VLLVDYVGESLGDLRLPVVSNSHRGELSKLAEPVTDIIFFHVVGEVLDKQSFTVSGHVFGSILGWG